MTNIGHDVDVLHPGDFGRGPRALGTAPTADPIFLEAAMPTFERAIHAALTVRDSRLSVGWHERVLSFDFVKEFEVAPGDAGIPRILLLHQHDTIMTVSCAERPGSRLIARHRADRARRHPRSRRQLWTSDHLSADTDFGELLAVSGATRPSVVLLRSADHLTPDQQATPLIANLPAVAAELDSGAAVSIARGRLCVRPLPVHPAPDPPGNQASCPAT
jgi:hypothetical protein